MNFSVTTAFLPNFMRIPSRRGQHSSPVQTPPPEPVMTEGDSWDGRGASDVRDGECASLARPPPASGAPAHGGHGATPDGRSRRASSGARPAGADPLGAPGPPPAGAWSGASAGTRLGPARPPGYPATPGLGPHPAWANPGLRPGAWASARVGLGPGPGPGPGPVRVQIGPGPGPGVRVRGPGPGSEVRVRGPGFGSAASAAAPSPAPTTGGRRPAAGRPASPAGRAGRVRRRRTAAARVPAPGPPPPGGPPLPPRRDDHHEHDHHEQERHRGDQTNDHHDSPSRTPSVPWTRGPRTDGSAALDVRAVPRCPRHPMCLFRPGGARPGTPGATGRRCRGMTPMSRAALFVRPP